MTRTFISHFPRHLFFLLLALVAMSGVGAPAHAAQITLAWDANSPTPDGYRLFQKVEGGAYDYSAPVCTAAGTSCAVNNLSSGTRYLFVVRAYAGTAESGNSNEVSYRYFTISASAGPGGGISPAGTTHVAENGSQGYTISAAPGYRIANVVVNNASVGAVSSYTFNNVTSNQTISASFAANALPVADAGPNQSVEEAHWVYLNGLNSYASDGRIVSYQWRQTQGPSVALDAPSSGETGFLAPDVGVQGAALVFELTVTDDQGATGVDTCIVNVVWVNEPPTANAGADQTVSTGDTVVLDGTQSVDPDDGIAAFHWIQTGGPQVVLSDPFDARPHFMAPDVDINGTSIRFQLMVTDHGGLQDSDSCLVSVSWGNAPPSADAGPDQEVRVGDTVFLDGSNSSDSDDGIASYRWQQTGGTPVDLFDANTVRASFIAPEVLQQGATLTFQLTVMDHGGLTHDDQCLVNVVWVNQPPVASAGGDQTVDGGEWVQLDGSGSSDPDDGIAAYQWSQTSGPAVQLSDVSAVQPTFTAPDVGSEGATLKFQLTVVDHSGLKATDSCAVNVVGLNQPPTAHAGQDQVVTAGERVVLDGSASHDSDDGIASFRWRQVSGTPVTLSDGDKAIAAFTAPMADDDTLLVFELIVTDRGGLNNADRCRVEVLGQGAPSQDTTPPVVRITSPTYGFVITSRSTISLKGTAWDDTAVESVVWHTDQGREGKAIGTTDWRINNIPLRRWFNTITVTAVDAAGNQSSTHLVVYTSMWR